MHAANDFEDDGEHKSVEAVEDTETDDAEKETAASEVVVEPASAIFLSAPSAVSSLLKPFDAPKPRWLAEIQSMEKNAYLFVHGKVNAFFAIASVVAKYGFRQPSTVIILGDSVEGTVTTVEGLAIYERGTAKIDRKFKDWHGDCSPIDLATFALDGAAGRWVYLFAQSEVENWDCVFGDDNTSH